MKSLHHVAASALISGGLYTISGSWGLTAASLLSGILVDADHIADYWLIHGLRFDLKQLFSYFDEHNFERRKKLFFIFHGWEWLIIAVVSAWLTDWNHWFTGLAIGYGQHMVLDELYNNARYRLRPHVLGYSLLWRWKNGFNFKMSSPQTASSGKP